MLAIGCVVMIGFYCQCTCMYIIGTGVCASVEDSFYSLQVLISFITKIQSVYIIIGLCSPPCKDCGNCFADNNMCPAGFTGSGCTEKGNHTCIAIVDWYSLSH